MARGQIPTPDVLRQLLSYDPKTGELFWKERPLSMFPDQRAMNSWNTRYSGQRAFASFSGTGYLQGSVFKHMLLAHRAIWAMQYGQWPTEIDHINGDKSDNRLANLRSVSRLENNRNLPAPANNTSGVPGVNYHKRDKRYRAFISVNNKSVHLGNFTSLAEAIAARAHALRELGFHENHGR